MRLAQLRVLPEGRRSSIRVRYMRILRLRPGVRAVLVRYGAHDGVMRGYAHVCYG